MGTFIIIIALIIVLSWLSKKLIKLGNFFDKVGNYFDDRSAADFKTSVLKKKRKTQEKIQAMSGEIPDEEYTNNVRKQIDKLTGGYNE
jgi:hypothetical protein